MAAEFFERVTPITWAKAEGIGRACDKVRPRFGSWRAHIRCGGIGCFFDPRLFHLDRERGPQGNTRARDERFDKLLVRVIGFAPARGPAGHDRLGTPIHQVHKLHKSAPRVLFAFKQRNDVLPKVHLQKLLSRERLSSLHARARMPGVHCPKPRSPCGTQIAWCKLSKNPRG